MATIDPNQPIAPVTPVAPEIATSATPVQVAAPSLMPTVNPAGVYSAQNIRETYTTSPKKLMDMKLGDLEKKISKANSIAEMNQIDIMNAPKAMGVLTGESAHQSRLDTAKLNALQGIYSVKLADEQRKEAERQDFISKYGADPKQRPKGMSKREFAKALGAGQFGELLTTDYKIKQADLSSKLKATGTASTTAVSALNSLLEKAAQMPEGGREWAASVATTFGVTPEAVRSATSQNGWEQAYKTPLTPVQQQAQIQADIDKQKGVQTAQKALGIVSQLEQSGSLGSAVGPVSSKLPTFRGATADFESNFNSLKSLLTLENMGIMKGVLSDSDMKVIQQASTALNLGMSESGFRNELQNVKTILETRIGQVNQGQKPMSDEEAYAEYLKTQK